MHLHENEVKMEGVLSYTSVNRLEKVTDSVA